MSLPASRSTTYAPGSQVDYADLNDLQDGVVSHEHLLATLRGLARINDEKDVAPSTSYVFAVGSGAAPYAGGSARQVNNVAGVLLQMVGGVFLAYPVTANELQTTLAVGDGSNPRIDLIQVKIVPGPPGPTLSFSTKQGTPAASPTEPTPDSGFVKWASVFVPTSFNTVIDPANIWDQRMPLGLKMIDIPGHLWSRTHASWTMSVGNVITPTVASAAAYAIPSYMGSWMGGRIVKVGISMNRLGGSASALSFQRVDFANSSAGFNETALTDYTASSLLSTAGSAQETRELSFLTGRPVWANGHYSGYANGTLYAPPYTAAPPYTPQAVPWFALKFAADGTPTADQVMFARFYIAG